MVGLAQLVRALDCGSRGRGFDSHNLPHFFANNKYVNLFCKFYIKITNYFELFYKKRL